jgi:imidazolonepropionase-like amidohydrolase
MLNRLLLCLAALLGLTARVNAQEKPQVFIGAQIIPMSGAPIAHGVLVVAGGKIVAVGTADKIAIPAGAEIHDITGKVLMPGLVDSHSHIGSGHLISGQTLYLKLREARTVDDLLIKLPDGTNAGGLKMANGTNSMRGANGFPGTRAKSAALVRAEYIKAQEYRDKIKRANGDAEKLPPRDLALEKMSEVLAGQRIVQNHTHRHDDILTVLRLAQEFGFKVVLHHVSEGWRVAPEIAAAHAPCSVIMIDSPGGKLETKDADWRTPAILEQAGVLVGFHTDDPICDSRRFLRSAALAVRAGMTRQGALAAVTIANAKILGLDARVGSLEPGKDADFIVLSADPLSVYAHIEQTWVEGTKVFDLSRPADHLYAVGGVGAGDARRAQLCCFTSAWDLIANANNGGDQ